MLNVGVIGYGYWGPNVARNFKNCRDVNLMAISDLNENRLKLAQQHYPYLKVVSDPMELIQSDDVQAVAIVTPVFTHYELAKAALEKGKHIFVEKPFTSSVREA